MKNNSWAKKIKNVGFQTRVIGASLAISLIPLVLLFAYLISQFNNTLLSNSKNSLNSNTQIAVTETKTYMQGVINLTAAAAKNTLFTTNSSLIDASLKNTSDTSNVFNAMNLYTKNGQSLGSSDPANDGGKPYSTYYGKTDPDETVFKQAATGKTGSVYLSNAYPGDTGPSFLAEAPVTDVSGNVVAVLIGEVQTSSFNDIIAGIDSQLVGGKHARIVDESGQILLSKLSSEKAFTPYSETKSSSVLASAITNPNTSGITQYKDSTGAQVISGYANLGKYGANNALNWTLVATEPTSAVLEPATKLTTTALSILAGVIIVIAVIAYFLSRSISGMILNPIRGAINKITEISHSLAATAQQASSASIQNASVSKQIASGALEQSSQAQQAAKSVSELSGTIEQISAAAQEAASTAITTSKISQNAGISSEKIGTAVDAITNVSEQTNLLALNAAIEAARAGDAGRGFAVVADEVRKLAEGSAKSADNIRQIVEEISTSSVNAAQAAQETSMKIQQLSQGTMKQVGTMTKINANVKAISGVANQSAAGVQQLSASIEQQAASNQQVAAAANELASLSASLQKLAGERVEEILNNKRGSETRPRVEESIESFNERHANIPETKIEEPEKEEESILDLPSLPELENRSETPAPGLEETTDKKNSDGSKPPLDTKQPGSQ